jgi:LmbE family N-acetylglucosaminyl deacetylase
MTHWFFAPHPDDAVFSCGGQIATLSRAGKRCVIVTVMAGDPPPEMRLTPFIEELWARWGLGDGARATAARRQEDQEAAAALGAAIVFLDFPDAVYRGFYPDAKAIFGEPAFPDMINVLAQLNEAIGTGLGRTIRRTDMVHLPLGIGNHVDHLMVGAAAGAFQRKPAIVFYEDFPYSRERALVDNTVATRKKSLRTEGAPEPIIHPLDDAALGAKIAAMGCYRSQVSSFWPDPAAMADEMKRYTAQVGGEREWRF